MKTFSSIFPFTNRFGLRGVTCLTNGAEGGGGGSNTKSSLEWHKPRVENFFHDAGGTDTFHREFQEQRKGNALSAPVKFTNGKRHTVGFWCQGRLWLRSGNQVYLYNVPLEIFEAWDEMGVDYQTGAEQVVEFRAPGRFAGGNQGLFIQLDEKNRTVWAKHFADAVRRVNEKTNRG